MIYSLISATASKPLIPNDNPGLPVQDEVCPFHQRMSYWAETLQRNRNSEMDKNEERFKFLKWVDSSFNNITVIPPGKCGKKYVKSISYLIVSIGFTKFHEINAFDFEKD